jgi:enoyl-CoA hydratase
VHRLGDVDAALAWADEIAVMAPLTIAAHKLALEGREEYDAARVSVWQSRDAEEGRRAFLEKRPPRFEGR